MLFRSKMDTALSAHDLTTPQFACLFQLHENAGISNSELARRCFITPQTTHKIVVGLEKKGWIKREPEPQHLRLQRTLLTPTGEQVLTEAKTVVSDLEKAMTTTFYADEIQRLQADLEARNNRLAPLP